MGLPDREPWRLGERFSVVERVLHRRPRIIGLFVFRVEAQGVAPDSGLPITRHNPAMPLERELLRAVVGFDDAASRPMKGPHGDALLVLIRDRRIVRNLLVQVDNKLPNKRCYGYTMLWVSREPSAQAC